MRGNVTASNILGSSADVFIQIIQTEGVPHSSKVTLAPCTKIELKATAPLGGEANLFSLTKDAKTTKDGIHQDLHEMGSGEQFLQVNLDRIICRHKGFNSGG
jgi:hypothetical protein